MEKEIRTIKNKIQRDINNGSRIVQGYAVIFDSQSENMGFYETIHSGAITQDTINNSDIFAKFNHNDSKVLARAKNGVGTLQLSVDNTGIFYRFEAPNTEMGNELLEYLNRGEIDSSSFAFQVADGGDTWTISDDGNVYRDIYNVEELFDVSPVFQPAYAATSCNKRCKDLRKKAEIEKNKETNKSLLSEIENL